MKCIHNALTGVTDTQLVAMWAHKKPEDAREQLAMPDVMVTNQSDKDMQLPKLLALNEQVMGFFTVATARKLHERGETVDELIADGFEPMMLVEASILDVEEGCESTITKAQEAAVSSPKPKSSACVVL